MTQRKNKQPKRKKINAKLATLFKMTRDELQTRKQTGGGTHRLKDITHRSRSEQKRKAIDDHVE